ncbi:MAG TPA: bifunctional phosphopantothenoylcysteine decarboxylase/phosphopantothenate--cysteine ligase CoaBC [Pseudomonadales bacterium]
MLSLSNKRVLLGVTGGIAAYKSAELIRRLQDAGAEVRVILTAAATQFITPLTLQALSGKPVHQDLLDPEAEAAMGHIELARWADLLLVAPASADFIARLTLGRADDLLTTTCLATRAPIAIAPAMNQAMWRNASTQKNVVEIRQRKIHIFGPAEGSQACGDVGPGRMLEPYELAQLSATLFETGLLSGKKVVITAGPTQEAIDPVRYISNHSSGKMGFALAAAAAEAGAQVTLITGPVHLATPDRVSRVDVVSAQDMYSASLDSAKNADIFIATAAVADYRMAEPAPEKIKKTAAEGMTIKLIKNPDIVAAIAQLSPKPFTVGFAAETQNLIAYAEKKIIDKNLDMIIANDVSRRDIGFNSDDNAVTAIWIGGNQALPLANKRQIAKQLVDLISKRTQNIAVTP